VAHQAILRGIVGYFLGTRVSDLPHVPVPLNTVFRLDPTPFGCLQTVYSLDLVRFMNGEPKFWTKEKKTYSLFNHDRSQLSPSK